MKVNRDEFLKAISTVKPATSQIEDMSNLYFSGKEIVAYNDRMCLHFPFESDFVFLINGTLLFSFLSKVSSEELVMSVKDDKLLLKSADEKATLTTVQESEIISRMNLVKEEFVKLKKKTSTLPENFIEGSYLCMFSASSDPSSGTLTCVSIDGAMIGSTDGNRLSAYALSEEMQPMMFEASVASELKKLSEMGLSKYIISDSWIHFVTDSGATLSVRKIMGEYPDLQKMIKTFRGKTKVKLPDELKEAAEIASLTVDTEKTLASTVKIELSKNKLKCVGSSEKGTIEKTSKVDYSGEGVSFSIRPNFLLEVLNKATMMLISNDDRLAMFRSGNFRHLMVLPINE